MGKVFLNEKEMMRGINICQENGTLNEKSIGWSRNPIFYCNLKGNKFRKKKWNYWYMVNEDCLFSATVADLDYIGMAFVYFYDFNTREFAEKTVITPFGKGCSISEKVFENVEFSNDKLQVLFEWNKYLKSMSILVHCKDFKGRNLTAKFSVFYPKGHETLNVLIPWNKNKFQFTSKQNCLPTEGRIMINNKTYTFDKSNSFAGLDFGRGIWPFKIMWNWATASGNQQGRIIGFNLGAKWTDGTGITENALLIDGKILKLNECILYDYDKNNLMKPWSIKTEISNKVNLIFKPIYDRMARTDVVLLKSTVHQIIGEFYGEIKDEQGNIINIKDLKGCAEEHYAKW
ncbi:hypothetical protein H04402_01468 [Clostridium botulinum H04402 065]|uniref:DUF2804 domain-containing protein n=1 Tax=Clostridium botulinum TaxID=1491 RepID=UPI0001F850D4|nr:DUF2804 domain-containing protein [Clostridium botulinum]MCJ8171866.1 DUF2804 domain-containing protein [Clostridium botulinum]OPD28474.1 hypothetical protein AL711_17355 [Clostridium botulinum]CBZ03280.1 hypothetical protein H04402_01468 [Clostridium botulinum H04402 065]